MNKLNLLITTLIGLWSIIGSANGKIVNCYYGTWSSDRPGDGKFEPSNIDSTLCTHLSYSFFGITPAGEFKMLNEQFDLQNGGIARTMELKRINPNLKVLAVVGGWNEGSINYSNMAADAKKRKLFIESALNFITKHRFDGLDLDWEYPTARGGQPKDKANFVTLLKELNEKLKPLNLDLGIAVSAAAGQASSSYDIPKVAKYVDFINVMAYDFAGTWTRSVGFNAPLKGQDKLNIKSAIDYWIQQGAPASKLLLGLAFYGRTFQLLNQKKFTVGSPITGAGAAGPFTREPGFMGYNEICKLDKTWSFKWAPEYDVPFVHRGNQWIGYDNVKSLELKVNYANSLGLGGVMIWSIESDDFRGKCDGIKYPLLKAVNNRLGNSQISVVEEYEEAEVPVQSSEPEEEYEPVQPEETGDCSVDGFFANTKDCSLYYRCVAGNRYDRKCNPGLYFDASISTCNWPNSVSCNY